MSSGSMLKMMAFGARRSASSFGFRFAPVMQVSLRASFASSAPRSPPFDKILVANRGEIACRVMETCKRMGIKTVAVYSEPDEFGKHVKMADEAICVGPAESAKSYLDMDAIMAACLKTGAQAVHPGYGFLSENRKFCELLESHGITFIGPKVRAITAMGLKIESKLIADEANVNTIPGVPGAIDSVEEAIVAANKIGYPVMLKASAGGGGKGMRVAWNDEGCREGFEMSREEAINSFSDGTMLIEKFIEQPRHIEIQVLCDGHGNGVYLNERECSIQRRNQKVVEEAPSSFIDPKTRAAMGAQALQLAHAVDYQSAGTVEFLVDKNRHFYFLEMNTRLQVEHPVTEYITGVDIVEHMIRVAAGEKLSLEQKDIGINGWSFESRVYAEDPFRNFLPSIGRLTAYQEPGEGDEDVRCDSGILAGQDISMYYDPLICKLVTYGPDRASALHKMRGALDSYVIGGVTHNVPFLRAVVDHPRFISGDFDTKFIEEEYPDGFVRAPLTTAGRHDLVASVALLHAKNIRRSSNITGRLETQTVEEYMAKKLGEMVIKVEDQDFKVCIPRDALMMSDPPHNFDMIEVTMAPLAEDGTLGDWETVQVAGGYSFGDRLCPSYLGSMEDETDAEEQYMQFLRAEPFKYRVAFQGAEHDVKVATTTENDYLKYMPIPEEVDYSNAIVSPMPGALVHLNVAVGDKVIIGQDICVVEAMKMQNALHSERDGVVKAIHFKVGDTVAADDIILEFEVSE